MTENGDEIRKARKARGLSQAQLGRNARVGSRTVGRLERGETKTDDTRALAQLQAYLKIGPYRSDEPDPEPAPYDPPLSQATAGELGTELMTRLLAAERALAQNGPAPATPRSARSALTKPGAVTLSDAALDIETPESNAPSGGTDAPEVG